MLGAELEDHAVTLDRLADGFAIFNRESQRLLVVHMLAETGCLGSDNRGPAFARREHQGVDILALQQFTVVVIGCARGVAVLSVHHIFGPFSGRFLHVADGDYAGLLTPGKTPDVAATHPADSDAAYRDAIARRCRAVGAESGSWNDRWKTKDAGSACDGCFQELTPGRTRRAIGYLHSGCTSPVA